MAPRFSIFGWPGKQAREASQRAMRRARSRSGRQAAALGLESLEDKRVLAVTVTPNFDGLGGLLIYDDASGPTANKVSLYMQDATGSSLYYTIGSGSLTTTPPVPLTGVTSIQFLDSLPDAGGTGDTLEIYGFGSSSITVSGRNLVFGGALPITTLNVENFVLDGQTSRAPMAFDGVGVTGNVTARNASVTTVAGTATYEIGGNLSIDTNTLQLAGALSARGVTSLSLSGGINQAAASPITTASLTIVNTIAGDVLLTNSRNAVGSVAITNLAEGGNVSFTDTDSLSVGVGGVGIVANTASSVNVFSGGILGIAAPISAGSGSVYLVAANGIGQAAAAEIVAHSLTFRNGSAATTGSNNVDLPGLDNCIDIVAGINYANNGSVSINGLDGMSIGPGVDGIAGLTAFNGVISVTTGDSLSIDSDILAETTSGGSSVNGGAILLTANNGIRQSGGGRLIGRSLSVNNNALGPVALDIAANDLAFVSVINTTPNGSVSYADANDFAVGIGGITTSGASAAVTLVSQGMISQLGAIVTRTLSLDNQNAAAGGVLLPLATNDVAFLNAANAFAGGTIRYTDANGFALGEAGIDAAGNQVALVAAGAVSQTGDLVADSLDIRQTGGGGVNLTNATNSISTLTGSIGSGTLAVTTQTPLSLGQAGISATTATVNITTAGSLTQTGAIAAQTLNASNTSALAGDIVLDNPANAIATFTASNAFGSGLVTLVNSTGTTVGAAGIIASGNDVSLSVRGSLSQAGRIVADTLTIANTSTTAGAITLDLATNDVSSFGASNAALADVVYRDASGFKISTNGINARQNISLTSVGDITQQPTGSIVGQNLSVTNLTEQVGSNVTLALPTNNVRSFVAASESPTGGVTLRTIGSLVIGVAGNGISATQGSIAVTAGGRLTLTANIDAGQDQEPAAVRSKVNLAATGGIAQTAGTVVTNDLVAVNNGVGEIILSASGNDVDRFAASNTGNITYSDIDSFETGVLRPGVPGDQVVEVATAGTLRLQAGTSGKDSLRIIGGLKFGVGKLFLSSGTTSSPGSVEYVTTSPNNGSPAFSGSLRDMIGYANVNQARIGTAVAPQSIVFDAAGYAVDEITISAALPAVTQRVTIDGTRIEPSLAANPRVGIKAAGPATSGNGLLIAPGASGSSVLGLAVTGFTKGAGIQLQSANNTITNTFLGVSRDGVTLSGNQYGIDLNVASATGNVIGGPAVDFGVPDDQVANVIGGNSIAGVMVRAGAAGNTIRGNYIGTDSTDASLGNIGSGIQVFSTANTVISENVVARNFGDGVFINSALATAATPNRLFANQIRNQMAAGVRVSNSAFASIGASGAGNVIGLNNVGIQITNRSSSVTVASNYVGTDEFETSLGNKTDGISVINSVGNTIGGVTIDLGNTSAFNGGSGLAIRNSFATTAAAGNRILSNTSDQNVAHGLLIDGGSHNTIGGVTSGNIATRNGGDGIRVQSFVNGTTRFVSSANQILGNLSGTDSRVGNVDLGNMGDGIAIVEGSANVVNQGNVARFNAQSGLRVEASSANVIGSDVAGEGNTFSDNLVNGATVTGGATNALTRGNRFSGNVIQSNGTDPGTTTTGAGIVVTGSRTTETAIGTRVANGRLVGVRNQIFENLGFGVSVVNGAQNTQIQSNSIYDNRLGAINRAGGTNANIAAPMNLTATVRQNAGTAPQIVITGIVAGTPRQQLAIDIYATATGEVDPTLPVGGRMHVGRFTVTITNVSGTTFTATLPMLTLVAGDQITATATTLTQASGSSTVATPIGSTSAMSAAVQLLLPTTTPTSAPINRTRRV